jgi:GAF domain-containing protein
MTLGRRVTSALELVNEARGRLDGHSGDADDVAVRASLDKVEEELRRLLTECEECDVKQAVFEIIAHVKDPEEALVRSLQYLTKRLDVDASGLRLREGEDFPYFITNGFSKEFVVAESQLCQKDSCGELVRDDVGNVVLECMCGNIVRGRTDPSKPFFTARGSFWTNSTSRLLDETTESDRLARTRDRCHGEGYESVALIPLRSRDETFGLLQFNDRASGKFTPQMIALLEDLSDYLAHLLA